MLNNLWESYKLDNNINSRDKIIGKCLPMIKSLAQNLSLYSSSCFDSDDLFSVGVIGLLDAIDKYDPSKQASFITYATIRIKGAMLDEIRKLRWATSVFQRKIKYLIKTNIYLEQKLLRPPTEEELAEEMNMKLEQFRKMLVQIGPSVIFMHSLEDPDNEDSYLDECYIEDKIHISPTDQVISNEAKMILAEAIKSLPKKSAIVIGLYYYEEMTMKEIGKVLSLTESRVCQLHAQALLKLFQAISNRIKSCEIQICEEVTASFAA